MFHAKLKYLQFNPTWTVPPGILRKDILPRVLQDPAYAGVLEHFRGNAAKVYATRIAKTVDGNRVAMWQGDAGYKEWDANASGGRHRLVMKKKDGFVFENTTESY